MVPACSGVNLRTSASTAATKKVTLSLGTPVSVVATVSGTSWSTACPTTKSGSTWYRISQVNGSAVSALYGVSYLYAASGVLSPAPTPAPGSATILDASVTFHGRGWGHGVGLSQYGARGRALAGQSAATILSHYYPGTTVGTTAAGKIIRVLILDNFAATSAVPLTVYGRGGSWSVAGIAVTLPADARLRLIPTTVGTATTWRLLADDKGTILIDQAAPSDLRINPGSAATSLQLYSKPSANDLYRGSFRILLTGKTADVINEVALESYLRGVVPAEMPSSWPTEAIRAQAIAARSYAAYRLKPGVGTFDAYDDTRSQVYLGIRQEKAATDAVIAATANQVVKTGSAIANTLFSSTGGGATENNENVFTSATGAITAGPLSYLRGSSDRDATGAAYDASSPYATWDTAAYTLDELSAIFAADPRTGVGDLTALDLSRRGVSGRLISVRLIGSSGTRTVSGNVFIGVFNVNRPAGDPLIRSTLVDIVPIP